LVENIALDSNNKHQITVTTDYISFTK